MDPVVKDFLSKWRALLYRILATDPLHILGQRYLSLAKNIPESFPAVDIVNALLHPVASSGSYLKTKFDVGRDGVRLHCGPYQIMKCFERVHYYIP